MSSFTKFDAKLLVSYSVQASLMLKKDYWLVERGFKFYIGTLEDDCWVNVPAGYLSDGASVPRALWSLIPPWGSYGQAAVLHDYLCEFLSITRNGVPEQITRETADDILNGAMAVLGVPETTRREIYAAVCAYRIVNKVRGPSVDPEKRRVEALLAQ